MQDQLKKSLLDPLKAGGDSTHAPDYSKNAQALIDSLKHKRGADILKGFFGSSRKDSTP